MALRPLGQALGRLLGLRFHLLCLLAPSAVCLRDASVLDVSAYVGDEVSLLHVSTAVTHRAASGNMSVARPSLARKAGWAQGTAPQASRFAALESWAHDRRAVRPINRTAIIEVILITILSVLSLWALLRCCTLLFFSRARRRKDPYHNYGGNCSTLLPPPGLHMEGDWSSEDSSSEPGLTKSEQLCPRINDSMVPKSGILAMSVPSLTSGLITQEHHVQREVTTPEGDKTIFIARKIGPTQHPDEAAKGDALESVFLHLPGGDGALGPELVRLVLTSMPEEEVQLQCQIYHEGDQLWGSVTADRVSAPTSACRPFTLFTRKHGPLLCLMPSSSSSLDGRRKIVDLRRDVAVAAVTETAQANARWQLECFPQADVMSIVALLFAADGLLDYEKFRHWRT